MRERKGERDGSRAAKDIREEEVEGRREGGRM